MPPSPPEHEHDHERLRRAIALAAKGRFRVEPNPIVGCVIEREGRVLGEGWHDGFGGAHDDQFGSSEANSPEQALH